MKGSFWGDQVPYFQNSFTGKYLTVHPDANPEFYYVPWVVSDGAIIAPGDLSHVSIKTQDREGILCPWEAAGLVWEYKTGPNSWATDDTIRVYCQ